MGLAAAAKRSKTGVALSGPGAFPRVTAKREPKASSVIGITVGGARVEVGAVADRDTLMVVLEALLASAGGRK